MHEAVMTQTFRCADEEATSETGRVLAGLLPPEATVHLIGDLGAGKTFLVRVMAAELGADPLEVSSPSFAIIHEYPRAGRPPIIHIDGYRLSESPREWLEIGIPDLLLGPGLKFVEWPKREFQQYETSHVEIEITVLDDNTREIDARL